ncbi:MAG: LamG domain-containing protein [Anaerolineales bacterium]|nr:LamG domain-containing protein [Anaerolineales bacterium]
MRPAAANTSGIILAEADDDNGWSLELDAGRPILWLSTNVGWQGVFYPAALPAAQWTHLAAVYDNGAVRLFVNGVSSTPATVGATLRIAAGGLRIGGVPGYSYLGGAVDDVRISASVRYTANFAPPAILPAPDANTLAQWAFNEGSGQSVADASPNGRTGTLGASTATGADDPVWGAANR